MHINTQIHWKKGAQMIQTTINKHVKTISCLKRRCRTHEIVHCLYTYKKKEVC